jgi:Ca2+-binding RTX toxin-like protein
VAVFPLTLVVMAFTAAIALAANVTGNGTLVGSTSNDSIKAGNGSDTIWGRGGSDYIVAGSGADVIDGGGSCPAGLAPGDYPNGLPSSDYCQHGPSGTFGTDSIRTGNGSDTVYGNGGANNIAVGNGADTILAYGGPNSVRVGNGPDRIYAYGTGAYTTGTGKDMIFAQFSAHDTIQCGSRSTTVFAVAGVGDTFSTSCTVKFVAPEPVPGQRAGARAISKTGTNKLTAKTAA